MMAETKGSLEVEAYVEKKIVKNHNRVFANCIE